MRMLLVAAVVAAAVAGVVLLAGSDAAEDRTHDAPRPAARVVRGAPAGVAAHLRALARAARRHGGNRAAGTAGERASADYVEGRLRAAGYRVWRQAVRFPYFRVLSSPRVDGVRGRDRVRVLAYSPSGDVTGRVRPVGLACGRDDARDLARGDVALADRGTCTFRRKALVAQAAGAGALLVVDRAAGARAAPVAGTLGSPGVRIPVLSLSAGAARSLPAEVRVRVRTVSDRRRSHNVLAESRGGDPRRVVMAGAHIDSVPAGPGLNDNGSGVAAVLDAAERLARARPAPGAGRLRVAFWTAEELGLYGSRRYLATLRQADRRALVAYLNLDMVGSPRARPGVYAAGRNATERRLARLLRAALRRRGVTPRRHRLGGASDHAPFARAGIPVGGLFTGAGPPADACYHRACDTLANVDAQLTATMAAAARSALMGLRRPPG